MPHFIADKIDKISYPTTYDNIKYNFEVKEKEYCLISVTSNKNKFFLTKNVNQKNHFIVKTEKTTRLPKISTLQKALIGFSKLSNANITKENIYKKDKNKNKQEAKNLTFIKDGSFFLDLFSQKNQLLKNKKVFIDIGFGSGRFILNESKKQKDAIFIGLELYYPALEQVSKQIFAQDIKNIYLYRYDARIFIESLRSNSIDGIFVHFPVPWDKKPQMRIYSKDFISEATRVLKKDGFLELRTDSQNYADFVLDLFNKTNKNIQHSTDKKLEISSKYEDRWNKLNKTIHHITYVNNDLSPNVENNFNFNFEEIKENLELEKLTFNSNVFEDYFVHFRHLYKGFDKEFQIYIIQVVFGSFNKAEHNFIMLKNNKLKYLINFTPSRCNFLAHKKIIKLLNQTTTEITK